MIVLLVFLLFGGHFSPAFANPPATFDGLADEYENRVLPLVRQFCLDCHNSQTREGELDLQQFAQLSAVREHPTVWQNVVHQLESGEMPPDGEEQPSDRQRLILIDWANRYLRAEAFAGAGDPGPVVLRRLGNSEYKYTIRDLTGVPSLDPAREFPLDGAAGEGFTNAGAALVMSPALLAKYLDAAKEVSQHAVLLPGRIEFSQKTTPRDWTEEKLSALREFYAKFTIPGGETSLNLQGVQFDSKDAGVIPLERYLEATIVEREALSAGTKTVAVVASERDLNAKYLGLLWETLNGAEPSLLLDILRRPWRTATIEDAASLAATVQQWQHLLWHLETVGHIGKRDGPKKWQQPSTPIANSQAIHLALPETPEEDEVALYLVSEDAGDGNSNDIVVWDQPRIILPNRKTVRLQDVAAISERIDPLMSDELSRTVDYLEAVAEAYATKKPTGAIAAERKLDPAVLATWAELVQLGLRTAPAVTGHFKEKLSNIGGYSSIHGWGSTPLPSLSANSAAEDISFSTLTVPGRGVTVHPSPDADAVIYWRSPLDGKVRIDGFVTDSDPSCGNGIAWQVNLISGVGECKVAAGVIDNGAKQKFSSDDVLPVSKGDLVKLAVKARDRDHVCDTTHISLTIKDVGNEELVWDLARDIVDTVDEGNPLADSHGNPEVWHLCALADEETTPSVLSPGSALAAWRESVIQGHPADMVKDAARAVQDMLTSHGSAANRGEENARQQENAGDLPTDQKPLAAADEAVRQRLLNWHGPLRWWERASENLPSPAGSENIQTTAPSVLTFRIPAELAAGAEFMTTGKLHPEEGREGSVQLRATLTKPADADMQSPRPATIVVTENSQSRQRLLQELEDFRHVFPAALCYTKIVPVDEVVTLQLFYREDDHLRRLMLNDEQAAELDQLWNELRFVSQEPLKLVDVYEQLWQYATQDADPSAFEPLREPIKEAARRFEKELVAAEPRHVDAVIEFAERAWRRPVTRAEQDELRSLYGELRKEELAHDAAIRMMLSRVLVSPAFLYKLERPQPGTAPTPVSHTELATRLSYFLWASAPDDELIALATAGDLNDDEVLAEQSQRMLKDPRVRRLATEFGCQWLGVRDFDQLDEKSERHFPEFAGLRDSMYEETIRFFTDFFQSDQSILSLLDADHTFVDRELAEFYGIPVAVDGDWQRVDGVGSQGRGGILAMATTLARQSGASRTSPILRGNWVYESLLGQQLPRPPKDVPQLPDALPEGLTERQLIERHSSDPACIKCHEKIDPYGFALEGFDAVGRARTAADTRSRLPDGREIDGLDGLRTYLLKDRRDDFVRQFCRKLLGYALGRGVQLSDEPLLDTMVAELAAKEYRISVAIEQIVLSSQFRMIRGKDASDSFALGAVQE